MRLPRPPSLILILILLALVSCGHKHDPVGRYEAKHPSEGSTIQMLLKADGKGQWTIARENIHFGWEQKGEEVWLHSRTGGVIVGKIDKDGSIDVDVPGAGRLLFKRIQTQARQ